MVWLSPGVPGAVGVSDARAASSAYVSGPRRQSFCTEHPKRPGTQSAVSTTTTGASARARPYNTNLTLIARFDADITLYRDVPYPPALRLFFITEQPQCDDKAHEAIGRLALAQLDRVVA